MKASFRGSRSWIAVLLLAGGVLIWSDVSRIRRVEYVTGIAQETTPASADTSTGYAGGTRELIVPEHLDTCYEWIVETQRMFARHEWRVRSADGENAPFGRPVHHASPYRWWLGLVAWGDHLVSGRPLGLSVERAALWADPLLHLLLLIAVTAFVARHFGSLPAGVTALGMVTLFPFAAGFLPAVPEDYSLTLALVLGSVLPLVVGLRLAAGETSPADAAGRGRRARTWFFAAGMAGGLGIWIDVGGAVPLQLGIAAGALLAAWMTRRGIADAATGGGSIPVWRAWALGGAITILPAYLLEYFPAHLANWELRVIHPLYGIAWLGGGELLARAAARIHRERPAHRRRDFVVIPLACIALAALPIVMWKTRNSGVFAIDLLSFHLTKQADGILAPELLAWLTRDGVTATAGATMLAILPLLAAVALLFRRGLAAGDRSALAVTCGPALVALALATVRLRWWQAFDAIVLVQAALGARILCRSTASMALRGAWLAVLAPACGAGLFQLTPVKGGTLPDVLSLPEVEGLVERDLAHWMARHAVDPATAIVLAPPDLTSALTFYGGLRGVGTLSWENKDGLSLALRIVISINQMEAKALINNRGITYIVIPSWDRFYEEYARPAGIQPGEMFYSTLLHGAFPAWLRPVPYQLPRIHGFGDQSLLILQVVDEQDGPSAASYLAEYYIEMGRLSEARAMADMLHRFPANLGALVARAQVAFALHDAEKFRELFDSVVQRISSGADRFMPWERRLSLAVLLAEGRRMDLARPEVERCLAEATATRLRSLTGYGLFHLEWLRRNFGLEIRSPELRTLIHDLLPPTGADAGA